MRISEIMNKVFVVDGNVSLKDAAKSMSDKNIGSLIVMNKDKMAGIITEGDIIKNVRNLGKKVSSVMSSKIVTIEKSSDIDIAARLMAKSKVKRLPVVNEGELVGIITATDLIANYEELNEEFFIE